MPTYEYRCPECGRLVEKFHSMSETPKYVCECGNVLLRSVSGGTAVLYRAKGFTQYKGRNGS